MTPGVEVFSCAATVADALADRVDARVRSALEAGLSFRLGLSGGGTPRGLFRRLAHLWSQSDRSSLEIFFVDERRVPPTDERSNFGQVRRLLLDELSRPPAVHRLEGESADPDEAAARYEKLLRHPTEIPERPDPSPQPFSRPPLDLVLLGIGEDGHTASLFPRSPILEERERWVRATAGPRPDDPGRLTLTLPCLNACKEVIFHVTGRTKAPVIGRILAGQGQEFPAAHVRPISGDLFWYLDEPAAETLSRP